ncbi:hypothetical protein ACSLBF_00990 [Pseudoalteromonas sp. T1lg65]|uniref:hypothetical protein n=1 Tax=Pseudoalteromonas sp. T1lg65 TaxID=2077101 RepID=UPI003F798A41
MKYSLKIFALITLASATFLSVATYAESTVVTSGGTYRCTNACVVDRNGGVTDSAGGHVWKLVQPVNVPKKPIDETK